LPDAMLQTHIVQRLSLILCHAGEDRVPGSGVRVVSSGWFGLVLS
jgi:hypothetical protein